MSSLAPPVSVLERSPAKPIVWQPVAAVALFLLAYLPLLASHFAYLWAKPHYQFFPMVLLGAALLVWVRSQGLGALQPGSRLLAGGLLAFSWLMLAAAILLYSHWLAMLAFLIAVPAFLLTLGGVAFFRQVWPAWAMLWLLLPPPLGFDERLIGRLQILTATASGRLLDWLGVFHQMAGNVVEVPGKRLLVEEACSGIQSLFAALACVLLYVFLMRRSWVRGPLLLAFTVAAVLLANVIRVAGIAFLYSRWQIDISSGWRHETVSWLLFAAVMLLCWSGDRLLLFFRPRRVPVAASYSALRGNAAATHWPDIRRTILGSGVFLAAFGLLAAGQCGWLVLRPDPPEAASLENLDLPLLGAEVMPSQDGAWRRVHFEKQTRDRLDPWGLYSQLWRYQWGQRHAAISLDYSFTGWHQLQICYQGIGWRIDSITPVTESGNDLGIALQMQKPPIHHGYVLFQAFGLDGQALESSPARPVGVSEYVLNKLEALRRFEPVKPKDQITTYQLQIFVDGYEPLTPGDKAEVQRFYMTAQTRINAVIQKTKAAGGVPPNIGKRQ